MNVHPLADGIMVKALPDIISTMVYNPPDKRKIANAIRAIVIILNDGLPIILLGRRNFLNLKARLLRNRLNFQLILPVFPLKSATMTLQYHIIVISS
jgi:hypothetical protein